MAIRKTDKVKKFFLTATSLALVAGTSAAIVVGVQSNQKSSITPLPEEEKTEIVVKQDFLNKLSLKDFQNFIDESKMTEVDFNNKLNEYVVQKWNEGLPNFFENNSEYQPKEALPQEPQIPEEVPPQIPEENNPSVNGKLELSDIVSEYIQYNENSERVLVITLTEKKFAKFKFIYGDPQNPNYDKCYVEQKGKVLKIILGNKDNSNDLKFYETIKINRLASAFASFMKSINIDKNKYSEQQFKSIYRQHLSKFYDELTPFNESWIEQNGVIYNDVDKTIEIQLKEIPYKKFEINEETKNVKFDSENSKIILSNFGFYLTFKMNSSIIQNINDFVTSNKYTIEDIRKQEILNKIKEILVQNMPGIKEEDISELFIDYNDNSSLFFKISSKNSNIHFDAGGNVPPLQPKIGKNQFGFTTFEFSISKDRIEYYTLYTFSKLQEGFDELNAKTSTLSVKEFQSQIKKVLEETFYKFIKINGSIFISKEFVNGSNYDEHNNILKITLKTASKKAKYEITETDNIKLSDEKDAIIISGLNFKS